MKLEVERAIEELRALFGKDQVIARDDGEGGAFVVVDGLDPGERYVQRSVWAGFRVTFQYPYADVYPHFISGELTRVDGRPLGEAMTPAGPFEGRPAIQISRRTIKPDPRFETAARKLQRILSWVSSRP